MKDTHEEEDRYLATLNHERHMFAWCLLQYSNMTEESANQVAQERYPYKTADDPWRELIFHDEAWHWAMLHLFGEAYWNSSPEFAEPPDAYEKEAHRWSA